MREMACEVVCAELVLWIEAFGFEVIGPFLDGGPIRGEEGTATVDFGQRGEKDELPVSSTGI